MQELLRLDHHLLGFMLLLLVERVSNSILSILNFSHNSAFFLFTSGDCPDLLQKQP